MMRLMNHDKEPSGILFLVVLSFFYSANHTSDPDLDTDVGEAMQRKVGEGGIHWLA